MAYGLRFVWGAFATKPVVPAQGREPVDVAGTTPLVSRRQPWLLVAPPMALAVLGLAVALVPSVGERLLSPYADQYPAGEPGHLVLWGGLTPVLGITVAVLVAGAFLFVQRTRVERWQDALWSPRGADVAYRRTMRRLDDLAADVTAGTQRGSLPIYLGIILAVLAVAPGLVVASGLLRGTTVDVEAGDVLFH